MDNEYIGVYRIGYCKGIEDTRERIIKIIKGIDSEKFIGKFCFRASSFKSKVIDKIKEIKSKRVGNE